MKNCCYKISIPSNISLFAGKNLRQTIKRDINNDEFIILKSASLLEKITVYEILFIMGLKTSMRRYVDTTFEYLYINNYLEIEEIFDKERLKSNLNKIFKEIYEKNEESGINVLSEDKNGQNILQFSQQEIKDAISRICEESEFVYQYHLTDQGKKALEEGKISKYSEEAIINWAILKFNFKRTDNDQAEFDSISKIFSKVNLV